MIRPLVSIVVATYNSSKYVCETLNSAFDQTYPNIEIIITDDCSQDNTVNLCNKWIDQHREFGRRLVLVTTDKNTGISGNFNRGLSVANGDWIKVIAGDDIFLPQAIESYIDFINDHPEASVVFGRINILRGEFPNYTVKQTDFYLKDYFFLNKNMTPAKQHRILSRTYVGSGPTFFAKRAVMTEMGGFDERFALQEDWPLYIKLTRYGYRLYLMDKVTILWRQNDNSITHQKVSQDSIFGKSKTRVIKEYKYGYLRENLNSFWRLLLLYSLWLQNKVIDKGNSFSIWESKMYFLIYRFTDPFIWSSRFYSYINMFFMKLHSN